MRAGFGWLYQTGIKAVAVKSEEQQAILALHRMREQLVKFRTAQINGLRGLLTEYGEVMPQGRAGIKRDIPGALGRLSDRLPAMAARRLGDPAYCGDPRSWALKCDRGGGDDGRSKSI